MRDERSAVLDLSLRMRGLQFVGMEHFGARDSDVRVTSFEEVAQADLYVGVIGGRRGSGITEAEYRHARALGLPCLIYLRRSAPAPAGDDDPVATCRQQAFEEELRRTHTCSNFGNAHELAALISADLHNWLFERLNSRGLERMPADYATRVQGFIAEYMGGVNRRVPFGGREAELAALDEWLDDADAPPSLLLAAGAGRGKSALLLHWAQSRVGHQDWVILFFPISIRFRTNLATVFFSSLTAFLGSLHEDMRVLRPDTPPEELRGRMAELLSRPLPAGRRLLLVLDGLDEAADWQPGSDLLPAQRRSGARVIVSARWLAGDTSTAAWLRRLGWDAPGAARAMELGGISPDGVAGVLQHMGQPLSTLAAREDIVTELHRLSEGDPLVVRLYVDDLTHLVPGRPAVDVEDLRRLNPGLKGFFDRWWDDQLSLWGGRAPLRQRQVQELLNLLSAALGALTLDDLIGLSPPDLELNRWALDEALEPLRRFIVGDGRTQGLVFSHPRLAYHLRDALSRTERKQLDERFIRWCESEVARVSPGMRDDEAPPEYVLLHFSAHLARSHQPATRYAPLLTKVWKDGWQRLGALSGYRADLQRLWDTLLVASADGDGSTAMPVFGLMVRCALCIVSAREVTQSTPVEMAAALVRLGLWGWHGALGYARAIDDPLRRAQALIDLSRFAPEGDSHAQVLEGLEGLAQIIDTEGGGRAAVRIVAAIAPQLRPSLVSPVLSIVLRIAEPEHGLNAAEQLVPSLPALWLPTLMKGLAERVGSNDRCRWVKRLLDTCPALSADPELLRDFTDEEQAWLLTDKAASSDGELRLRLLSRAKLLIDRSQAPTVDSPHAAELELMIAWLEVAHPASDEAWLALLPAAIDRLPERMQKARLLSGLAALEHVRTGADGEYQARARRLRATLVEDRWRDEVIAELAPRADPEERAHWVALALAEHDDDRRVAMLAALLPVVGLHERAEVQAALLAAAKAVSAFDAPVTVAELLDDNSCAHLAELIASSERVSRSEVLDWMRILAPRLSPQTAAALCNLAADRERNLQLSAVVVALSQRVPPDARPEIARALAAAPSTWSDVELLEQLAAAWNGDELRPLVEMAHERAHLVALANALRREDAERAVQRLQRLGGAWQAAKVLESCLQQIESSLALAFMTGERSNQGLALPPHLASAWNSLDDDPRGRVVLVHWMRHRDAFVGHDAAVADALLRMRDDALAPAMSAWAEAGGCERLDDTMLMRCLRRVAAWGPERPRDPVVAALCHAAPLHLLQGEFDAFLDATLTFNRGSVALSAEIAQRAVSNCFEHSFAAACGRNVSGTDRGESDRGIEGIPKRETDDRNEAEAESEALRPLLHLVGCAATLPKPMRDTALGLFGTFLAKRNEDWRCAFLIAVSRSFLADDGNLQLWAVEQVLGLDDLVLRLRAAVALFRRLGEGHRIVMRDRLWDTTEALGPVGARRLPRVSNRIELTQAVQLDAIAVALAMLLPAPIGDGSRFGTTLRQQALPLAVDRRHMVLIAPFAENLPAAWASELGDAAAGSLLSLRDELSITDLRGRGWVIDAATPAMQARLRRRASALLRRETLAVRAGRPCPNLGGRLPAGAADVLARLRRRLSPEQQRRWWADLEEATRNLDRRARLTLLGDVPLGFAIHSRSGIRELVASATIFGDGTMLSSRWFVDAAVRYVINSPLDLKIAIVATAMAGSHVEGKAHWADLADIVIQRLRTGMCDATSLVALDRPLVEIWPKCMSNSVSGPFELDSLELEERCELPPVPAAAESWLHSVTLGSDYLSPATMVDEQTRDSLLNALARNLPLSGQRFSTDALEAIAAAVHDVCHWWP